MGCSCSVRFCIFTATALGGLASATAEPVKLNGQLAANGSVDAKFQFSPDGSRVLYAAQQNSSVLELFSVPSGGGESLQLSGTMVAGGNVVAGTGQFTPDGSRVLYLADQYTNDQFELYSVASAGGTPAKVSGPLISFGDVDPAFRISADGSRVAYIANAETDFVFSIIWELFSVSTSGGDVAKLNGPLANGGDVTFGSAQFSPDGSRVFYLADQTTNDQWELYGVESTGGTPAKLNGPMVASGDVDAKYDVSPDGQRVLYIANAELTPLFQPIVEIFSVPAAGGEAVKLNGPLVSGGNVVPGSGRFSPDGSRAIYLADEQTNEVFELFSVLSAGGGRVKLNGPLVTNGDVSLAGLQFSPDSSRVIYGADQHVDNLQELFSVPTVGGDAVPLSGTTGTFSAIDLTSAAFSPDGNHVLFRAIESGGSAYELFTTASDGGMPLRLNDGLPPGGGVVRAGFSPDGSRVVYLADQETAGVFELFSVATAGGMPAKISDVLTVNGNVTDWQFSPDGRYLVYRADQDQDQVFELFAIDFGGSGSAVLDGDLNFDGVVDAADYTVWRNGLGEGAYEAFHYDIWKSNYGRRSDVEAGGGSLPAVPEPAAVCHLAAALTVLVLKGRRAKNWGATSCGSPRVEWPAPISASAA